MPWFLRSPRRSAGALAELLGGLTLLTAFWAIGAGLAHLLPILPLPGSLWGMLLLFLALRAGLIREAWLARTARRLIAGLGLLFTPVGVGILAHERLVLAHAPAIAAALIVGSLLTLAAAAGAARAARPAEPAASSPGRRAP